MKKSTKKLALVAGGLGLGVLAVAGYKFQEAKANGTIGFSEKCESLNLSKWGITWNAPSVESGTWAFHFNAETQKNIQVMYLDKCNYGTFTLDFRTSGPRVADTNYWVFLYYAPDGDFTPTAQELDLMEVYGNRPYPSEFVTGFWRDGKTGTMNVGYWYTVSAVNWEDGNWHRFKFDFTKNRVAFYVDDILVFDTNTAYKGTEDISTVIP